VTTSTETPKDPETGAALLGPISKQAWWHRKLEPEERQRIMKDLAIRKIEHWGFRFTVMLTLSIIVAVMGLQLDSAAVVIGAMLLAPLMQPVLATAACISMALFKKSVAAFIKIILATAWCVGIAYTLSKILPDQFFTSEVLSRTRPDGKDLIVALAAGAAGSYATVREDVSASLPGVAVAVALVPPLGTLGVTLEAGDYDKAWGALLLYSTNLAAIILVSIFVFVLTGFVPPRRLETNWVRLAIATLSIFIIVGFIGFPLVQASRTSAQVSRDDAAKEIVDQWLSETDVREEVYVGSDYISVGLRGSGQPPDDQSLKAQMRTVFGDKEVRIEWVQVELTPADAKKEEVREVVLEWLSMVEGRELENLELVGNDLRIDATGAGEPPSGDELGVLLEERFETEFATTINWVPRQIIRSVTETESEAMLLENEFRALTNVWASENDVKVTRFNLDQNTLSVDVSGSQTPETEDFIEELNLLSDEEIIVEIFFTERILITDG